MAPHLQIRDVHARLGEILQGPHSDDELCRWLDQPVQAGWFSSFCQLHGPELYRRNPTAFRAILLRWLEAAIEEPEEQGYDPWRGPEAGRLDGWLEDADEANDVPIFLALHAWRARSLPLAERVVRWREELVHRVRSAGSEAERLTELAKMNQGFDLDEAAAVALYEIDPDLSSKFIREHMPVTSGAPGDYWATLSSNARKRGDQDFFFAVYRHTVEEEQWARDVKLLADRLESAHEIVSELQRRHPDGLRRNVSSVIHSLLVKRGEDVLPYASLVVARSADGMLEEPRRLAELVRLADARGWLDLWASLLMVAEPPTVRTAPDTDAMGAVDGVVKVDREVRRIVDDQTRSEHELVRRLERIALERSGRRRVRGRCGRLTLSDESAATMYARFPSVLRGAFRQRLCVGTHGYPRLLRASIACGDDELTDYLASLVVVLDLRLEWTRREVSSMVDMLRAELEKVAERQGDGQGEEVARRAARILGFVSPGALPRGGYPSIVSVNRLAAFLWSLPYATYLSSSSAIGDLLESEEPHARWLAFRVLAAKDPRARTVARAHLPLLVAALFGPLPRKARRAAFEALDNVAEDDATAAVIVPAVRDACDLPDHGYPKEALTALLGSILQRHASLRSPSEEPVARDGARS